MTERWSNIWSSSNDLFFFLLLFLTLSWSCWALTQCSHLAFQPQKTPCSDYRATQTEACAKICNRCPKEQIFICCFFCRGVFWPEESRFQGGKLKLLTRLQQEVTERTGDRPSGGPQAIRDKACEGEDVCVWDAGWWWAPMRGGKLPTFLHGLKRIVGLDKFHRVGDFLALQNVVTQTQVWDGKLENLVVSHGVFLEYGTCGGKQRVTWRTFTLCRCRAATQNS